MSVKKLLGGRALPNNIHIPATGSFSPTCIYKAEDAKPSTWVAEVGTDLGIVASPTYFQSGGAFGAKDLAVDTSGDSGFTAATDSTYNPSSEDLIFLLVAYVEADNVRKIPFGKSNFVTAQFRGYYLEVDGSNVPRFTYINQSNFGGQIVGSALTTGWHMFMIAIDNDEASTNGSQIYVDGVRNGSGADLSAAGTVANLGDFKLGFGDDSFTVPWNNKISHFRMYQHTGMFPGGSDNLVVWDKLAEEFYRSWAEGIPYIA